LLEQSKGDPDALAKLYQDHFELICYEKAVRLDEDPPHLSLEPTAPEAS
jgi:hypothetical protein